MSKRQEYILKLEQVWKEVRREAIIAFDETGLDEHEDWRFNAELNGRVHYMNRLIGGGKLKKAKKSGISVTAMLVNRIVEK